LKPSFVLDLAPRQSGKSTRLREAMLKYTAEDPENTAILVSPSLDNSRNTLRQLTSEERERIFVAPSMWDARGKVKKGRFFVDEFCFIKSDKLFQDPNAYYTSTLKNLDMDQFTVDLLRYDHHLNNRKFPDRFNMSNPLVKFIFPYCRNFLKEHDHHLDFCNIENIIGEVSNVFGLDYLETIQFVMNWCQHEGIILNNDWKFTNPYPGNTKWYYA